MKVKVALKRIFDRIASNIGIESDIKTIMDKSWDELPDRELSIRNIVKAFELNPRLNPPAPHIEIEEYLNDFADEIIRAGQAQHEICNCGTNMAGHVFSEYITFLFKYVELETGMKIKIAIERSTPGGTPKIFQDFMHHRPSQN